MSELRNVDLDFDFHFDFFFFSKSIMFMFKKYFEDVLTTENGIFHQ